MVARRVDLAGQQERRWKLTTMTTMMKRRRMRKKRTRRMRMMTTIKLSGKLELSCLQNNVNAFYSI